MNRILVISSSYTGGDLNVLAAVTRGLTERGHDVCFVGDEAVVGIVQPLGVPVSVLAPELDLRAHMVRFARGIKKDRSRAGDLFLERLLDWIGAVTPDIVKVIHQYRPDLLLAGGGMILLTDRVAAESSVPWGLINGSFYLGPGAEETIEEDYSHLVAPLTRHNVTAVGRASLAVHGTPAVLNTHSDLPPHHRYVGPLVWESLQPTPGYLDEHGDPWALVTLSLMTQNDIPIAQAALDALDNRPLRVVVTLGPDHTADELSRIPPNARVEQSVPHTAVLDRAALLVSPGGTGAVMKAMQRGVPMVLVPMGVDHPGVARRAERLGVACVIPHAEFTRERLSEAIDAVLTEPGYRRAAQDVAKHFQGLHPVADACAHIEAFLRGNTVAR